MVPTAAGKFSPKQAVTRAELAYTLVQNLGLQADAESKMNETITVQYGNSRIAISDSSSVPTHLPAMFNLL
jgi:serine protease AprX